MKLAGMSLKERRRHRNETSKRSRERKFSEAKPLTCGVCGCLFQSRYGSRYCSRECGYVAMAKSKLTVKLKACKVCEKLFKPRIAKQEHCSAVCARLTRSSTSYKTSPKMLDKLAKQSALWADKRAKKKWPRAFHGKIFQTRICLDCGSPFDTLYPDKFIGGCYYDTIVGSVRCVPCRLSRRLAIHGGGPSRRCKQFDVPYNSISYRMVFLRDNWICQICGIQTPESTRGTFEDNAPEVDHIWPLSLVVDGVKSPGHVLSNCQTACRKCNIEKGAKRQ